MRIAVFGGTFNPPHKGHVAVVKMLLKKADEVFVMVANHPNKPFPNLAPANDRLRMAHLAFDLPGVRIRSDEIRRGGTSFTQVSLSRLERAYPGHQFHWVIGSDLVSQVSTWKSSARLMKKSFWIVFRPYVPIDRKSLARFSHYRILRGPGLEISSTDIRRWISQKRSIKASRFLPASVLAWIRKKKLYISSK